MRNIRIAQLVWAAATVLLVATAMAQDCVDYGEYLHRDGRSFYPDEYIMDCIQYGDVLLAAVHEVGLVRIALGPDGPGEVMDRIVIFPEGSAGVVAQGGIAAACDHDGLLSIVRAVPGEPMMLLGSVDVGGYVWSMAMADDLLLLARGGAGLIAVDISTPSAPTVVDNLPSADARGLALSGSICYLGDDDLGLRVIDITNPGDLTEIIQIEIAPGAGELCVDGQRLAVVEREAGVRLFDTSIPAAPVATAHVDIPANMVVMSGDQLRLRESNTLHTIQLDPTGQFDHQGAITISPSVYAMVDLDGSVLLAHRWGFDCIDTSNPYSVQPRPSLDGLEMNDFALRDGLMALITDNGHLQLYGHDGSDVTTLQSEVELGGDLTEMIMVGDWIYVGAHTGPTGVAAVNIADPSQPVVAWNLRLASFHDNLAVSGDLLTVLCAGGYGLYVIDISNPAEPALRGEVSASGMDLAMVGDVAYVAANLQGLGVVDLSDPDHPQLVRMVEAAGLPRGIGISGQLMVTYDYNAGLSTFSLADPLWPEYLGMAWTPTGGQGSVLVQDQTAYLVSWSDGLLVFDITDPTAPAEIGSATGTGSRARLYAGALHTRARSTGLLTFPWHCEQAVAIELSHFAASVTEVGVALAWASNGQTAPLRLRHLSGRIVPHHAAAGGSFTALDDHPSLHTQDSATYVLETLDHQGRWQELARRTVTLALDDPTMALSVAPNPCNPGTTIRFATTTAGPVRCRIVDLRGRQVAMLADGWHAAGHHAMPWDGRGADGRTLATGNYLVRIDTPTRSLTGRVSIIK